MLSTVHPRDLSAGSFQRSPKYLHSSAVWPACNPASPKPPCLSDSGADFSIGGVRITQDSSHKVFREPSFARRNGCTAPSRMVLPTHLLHLMNPFFRRKEIGRERATLLMLHPCTLLPPIPWGDWGTMDKSVQQLLLERLAWTCWLYGLCLEGSWVHLQHAAFSLVSTVCSLQNNFRLV